jgi:hypothetical protein
MKIGILSAITDTNPWTKTGTCDYADVSIKNHNQYCVKHNYNYVFGVFKKEEYQNLHPTWIKILFLNMYLDFFDYVVWIDADCVIVDKSKKIEDFIEVGVDLVVPKMELDRESNQMWTTISTGFMIFRNSIFSKHLLKYLIDVDPQEKNRGFHEQTVLDNYLRQQGVFENSENLKFKRHEDLLEPHISNNIKVLPYKYHKCYFDGEFSFLYHAGGNSITKKERLIESLK